MRIKYALACFLVILIKGTISQTQTGTRISTRDRNIAIRSRISDPGTSRTMSRVRAPGRQRMRTRIPTPRRMPMQMQMMGLRQDPRSRPINTQISPRRGSPSPMRSSVGLTRRISRTGRRVPMMGRPIPRSSQSSSNINNNNLFPLSNLPCDRSRVVVCRQVMRSRMTCYSRGCRLQSCIVNCVCVCVSRSLRLNPGSRVFATRRVTPPGRSPVRVRNNLQIRPNIRPNVRQMMTQTSNSTRMPNLSFGLSESALASVLSNPDVSSLVGPQGLNDILAGRPPPLLTQAERNQTIARGLGNPGPAPNGIPIPLSAPRLDPGPSTADLMMAGLMASDFMEIPELPMRTNIPAVNESRTGLLPPGSSVDIGSNSTVDGSVAPGGQATTGLSQFLDLMVQTAVPVSAGPTKEDCMAQRKELWCDPVGIWADTPGVSRWCILNCRASDCDTQRCACACIEEVLFKQKYEQLRAP